MGEVVVGQIGGLVEPVEGVLFFRTELITHDKKVNIDSRQSNK